MAELFTCPKCGGSNAKSYVNHKGWKVGKCPDCNFWGNLGKAEAKPEAEAKPKTRKRTKAAYKSKAVTTPGGRAKQSGPVPNPQPAREPKRDGPIPYQPSKLRRWWDDFIS